MNKNDIGALKPGMTVTVARKRSALGMATSFERGEIVNVHEPEWVDHATKIHMKELQGADVRLNGKNVYIEACNIST